LTLWVGRQEGRPACKKLEWWGAGMVVCLERGAHLHMAQLVPLALTISCFIKIQIGFTFLVPAHSGSPGQRAIKRLCVVCEQASVMHRRSMSVASVQRHCGIADLQADFANVATKTFRFPVSVADDQQLVVLEFSAESRLTYSLPAQLL